MRALFLFLLLGLFCAPAVAGENRLGFGRIALDGNIESVQLDFGPLGTTTLTGGEAGRTFSNTTFRIPIPAAGETGALLVPTVTSSGGGEARYLGWDSAPAPLSAPLQMRSRPPVLRELPRPTVLSLLLIVLSAFGIWLARRAGRPVAAFAIGTAAASALLGWSSVFLRVDSDVARVVDFAGIGESAAAGDWKGVEITGRFEAISFDESALSLEVSPQGSPIGLEMNMELLGPGGGEWRAQGPPASKMWIRRIWTGSEGPWLGDSAEPAQDLGDFQASWRRSSASELTAFGPWQAGAERPKPGSGRLDPPSWLLSGLPMGREVFLGRLAESGTWIRAVWAPR